jgi:chromosome segregation ATPase
MDDSIADFISDISLTTDGPEAAGDGVLDAGIDATQATQQERLFREDLSRWSTMSPGSADSAMNPFATDPATARIGRGGKVASPDDLQAQLRALSARNAFLSLALDAAVAESSNLKAEHAELATLAAQATVARQRHEAEIAEAKKAQKLLRGELDGAHREVARLQAELQSMVETVEQRSAQSSAEHERLAADANEAARARQQTEAELVRLQRSNHQLEEQLAQHRADISRLQRELQSALSTAEEHDTQRIAEQVDFTAAAAEASAARQRIEAELKRLQQKHRQTGSALEKSRSEARQLQADLERATAAQRDLEARLVLGREAADAAAKELGQLRADLQAALEREAEAGRQLEESHAALKLASSEISEERQQLEAQLAEARDNQQRTTKMLEFLQAETARLRQQIEHAGSQDREASARWESERTTLVLAIDEAAARRRALETELREARQTQQMLGEGIGQARHEIERLSRLQPRIDALERERDALRITKEQAVDQLKHLLEVAQRETAEAFDALKAARVERDELAAQLPFRDAAMQALRDELEALRAQLQTSPAAPVTTPVADDSATVRRMQARLDAQAENRQRYAEEMRALRKRVAELESACRRLERALADGAAH